MKRFIQTEGGFNGSHPMPITWAVTETGCHECTSHRPNRNKCGYIRLRRNGGHFMLHRFMYEKHYLDGKLIPEGLIVRHKCDNSICINPEHLELGTQQDNIQDTIARGRKSIVKGSANKNSKLTEPIVYQILCEPLSKTDQELASTYGVFYSGISKIRNRKSWLHVIPPDGYKIPNRRKKTC